MHSLGVHFLYMKDENKKISSNRAKKEVIVAELSTKVEKAKAMVFTNYQGMTHKQIEDLKKALKTADAELFVAKNTLLAISLKDYKDKMQELQGATATIFAYGDVIEPLKALAKSVKTLTLPKIKFGIIEGGLLAEKEIIRLSSLPSREVLVAQLIGGMKSPIYGLHRALNWNIQKFVMTLKAIEAKKS